MTDPASLEPTTTTPPESTAASEAPPGLTPRQAVLLVVRRELTERTRQKSFAISTGVTLLIVLAIAVLPGLLGDDGPKEYDVGVVGAAGAPLADALQRVDLGRDLRVTTRVVPERSEAERLVHDGSLDVAIDGETVIVEEELAGELEALVQLANRDVRTQQALAAAGVSGEQAEAITDPPPLRTATLDPPNQAQDERRGLVTFGVFFVFGQIFGYGFAVASSVVEEKSSRVVELLLAKIRPSQLLTGKIVGVGALGFAQLVLFFAIGLAAATASGSIDMPPGMAGAFALVLGWFLLGFALYSALFAMSGAVASRVEELQNTSSPITFVIMAGYVGTIAAAGDPGGAVARVTSFFPFWAPLVMPIRMAAGEVPAWEVALVVALVLATVVMVVRLAARIYAGGALRTRGRIKLREAYSDAARA
ncbi:MAG TPA: ABC transporter permease [Acidimicrobiales bacterium]|nr:ABC transporter permease [Acidimicrobiales bacterium]